MRTLVFAFMLASSVSVASAQSAESCVIRAGEHAENLSLDIELTNCTADRGCHQSDSEVPGARWTGLTTADLSREGHAADAVLQAEAGELHCVGTVHEGALRGDFHVTPHAEFVARMKAMGFEFDDAKPRQLQGYARLNVSSDWVKQMKDAGVTGLTTSNLLGLKALKVDPEYVRAMAAAGYPELRAGKLTSMKAVGVTPAKVQAIRAMGYQPTEEQLVQMSVFKIDAAFVERVKAHGFKDPTIAQLIKMKTFKLDE